MVIATQYYICNRCPFRTTLLSRINNHLQVHAGTTQPSYFNCFDQLKLLKCHSCDFSTESLILLRYHLVCKHDQLQFALKAKLKTCKKCGFCTHSNYLWIRHPIFGNCKGKKRSNETIKKDSVPMRKVGKWYLCERCNYRTVNSHNLKNHVINKHTPLKEIDWKQCTKCPRKYKTLDTLKNHQKTGHMLAVDHLNCPECDYSTPLRHNLRTHFNSKHARPEDIKWVECYHCGVKFKDKLSLRKHLKRHTTKEKQYKCDQCPFETHRKDNLKNHIVSRHLKDEDIKWYNCQHCDYKAKRKESIKNHIQSKHSESVELIQCPHCSFKTKRNDSLRHHITRFHDVSTFKCDLCNYLAKYEKTIEIHKKNNHGSGGFKRLKCEFCDYSSKWKDNLKNHVLVKHNTDGEVFQCKMCKYNSRSKKNLTEHIRRMHKRSKVEATITCENCSFVTKTIQQLQDHIFNIHKQETSDSASQTQEW